MAWYGYNDDAQRHQLVVPFQMRLAVMSLAHEGKAARHFTREKIIAKIGKFFYLPDLARDIKNFCQSCDVCQKRKALPSSPHH